MYPITTIGEVSEPGALDVVLVPLGLAGQERGVFAGLALGLLVGALVGAALLRR